LHISKKSSTFAAAKVMSSMKPFNSYVIMSIASLLLHSCQAFSTPQAPIKSFSYNYDGTIGGNTFSWTVTRKEDGTVLFQQFDHMRTGHEDLYDTLPAAFMDSLEAICSKHKIHRWDGFRGNNQYVCDGDGFSLSIRYEDGRKVDAHGMNSYPNGFREFRDDLYELCNPIRDHIWEMARQRKREKGVSGDLQGMLWVFSNHYPGPDYTYEALIRHDALIENNVDITIKHSDGSIFPEGDFRIYCRVTDDKIHWDKFAALIQKHRLARWCDFDEHDTENKAAEWFQVGFDFDEGEINASGSAHPEDYDAFREEFLQLFVNTFGFLFDKKD